MNPYPFIAACVLATLGVLVAVAGWKGVLPTLEQRSFPSQADSAVEIDKLGLRTGLALLALVGTYLLTGWPVGGVLAACAAAALPTFAAAKRQRRDAIDRVEAIAGWIESLRDTMAASAGIQQAVKVTSRTAPLPIRREVSDLAARLEHQPTNQALARFAADVKHPVADMVVASLVLASSRHAGSLQGVLRVAAKTARDSAAMMRGVEAGRARTYSQARLVGWATVVLLVFLVLTKRPFLEPFDSFGGQIAMGLLGLIFAGSGFALYRLGRPVPPKRLFAGIETWTATMLPESSAVRGGP